MNATSELNREYNLLKNASDVFSYDIITARFLIFFLPLPIVFFSLAIGLSDSGYPKDLWGLSLAFSFLLVAADFALFRELLFGIYTTYSSSKINFYQEKLTPEEKTYLCALFDKSFKEIAQSNKAKIKKALNERLSNVENALKNREHSKMNSKQTKTKQEFFLKIIEQE